MPIAGTIQPKVICPYCSRQVAQGYLWLHKHTYCPMRPDRQEIVKKEAMGTDIHGNAIDVMSKSIKAPVLQGTTVGTTGHSSGLMSGAIREIDLKEEYKMATTKVNPKKEADDYECGACGNKFAEKAKHCPHCGVELE